MSLSMSLSMRFFLKHVMLVLGLSSPLWGGVQVDMGKFFKGLGAVTNSNEGAAYRDQSAGYYTGGSFFARNTVHNTQLASLRLPGYRAGCGGIDMHFGAFSFISSEALVKAMKAIGSSMASYAMLLALETMSPQIKNILTELNDLAQKINQMNLNSCELAATTLGALLPQSEAGKRHLCTMIGTDGTYGGFSDYAAAKQGCGAGGKREAVLAAGEKDPKFAKMLGSEFNLAWNAIQENKFLRANRELAEFFMSLSGTILSTKPAEGTEGSYQISSKPSLADKNSMLSALLFGGKTHLYRCKGLSSDPKCLKVEMEPLEINPSKAFVARVKQVLMAIQQKIYDDLPLNESEKAFLNLTRLPFYKILNVATAYRRGMAPLDILDYSELAAIDILFQYLSEILDVVHESAAHLKTVQIDPTQIRQFEQGLALARQRISERRMGTFKQIEQVLAIIRKTELLEKSLAVKLGVLAAEGI
jgi:conjugative transfer pilus assembly protein TraH